MDVQDEPQLQTDTSRRMYALAGVFLGGMAIGIVSTYVVKWLIGGAGSSGGEFDAEDWRGR